MKNYLNLMFDVLYEGTKKPTRAKINGEHVAAFSLFGRTLRFDLADGFPLVTTRRISWVTAAHELIWMLSGDTNVRYLQQNGVNIWNKWADDAGNLGPIYGAQLRHWRAIDPAGHGHYEIDQVDNLLADIAAVKADPCAAPGRRLILTMWNVGELKDMALPPCPMMAQFNVTNGKLSCMVTQRSADLFIGLPYDIAVYAMLTHVIAHIAGLTVGDLVFSLGDAHIYENHVEAVAKQLQRTPRQPPRLTVYNLGHLDDLEIANLYVDGYTHDEALTAEVAV